MINELLWTGLFATNFLIIISIYKVWGKTGLYAYMGVSLIIANIQVTKTIKIFGLTATLGNIVYASSFLITDILSELHSKEESRKAVYIGFMALISMVLLMQLGLLFTSAPSDSTQPALIKIFSLMPRIVAGSFTAFLVGNLHDVWAFHVWKDKTNGKHLWFRNNASTMISQLFDSLIFCFIAFWGLFPFDVWIQIFITTYILKWVVAALDTPFLYLAKKIK